MTVAGVRTTHPARTCLEIARLHGFPDGLVATDSALRQHGVTTYDLREELARMQRTRGQAAMRKVIEHAYGGSESPYESYLRALIIERFPQVKIEPQKPLLGKYRADLCLDGWLVVEVDGDAKYDGTYGKEPVHVVKQQIKRQRALENRGYVVLRFGSSEVKASDEALRIIASHLGKRGRKVA
ncbi:endonuclease domain-containing protein [Corynebacterium sp. LaCa222]|uniref:endonuclease domain-containing protein n=1 Tax=Corynebacterium sp. LaCa222 TaxID=3391427 RepID=UPI0004244E44